MKLILNDLLLIGAGLVTVASALPGPTGHNFAVVESFNMAARGVDQSMSKRCISSDPTEGVCGDTVGIPYGSYSSCDGTEIGWSTFDPANNERECSGSWNSDQSVCVVACGCKNPLVCTEDGFCYNPMGSICGE